MWKWAYAKKQCFTECWKLKIMLVLVREFLFVLCTSHRVSICNWWRCRLEAFSNTLFCDKATFIKDRFIIHNEYVLIFENLQDDKKWFYVWFGLCNDEINKPYFWRNFQQQIILDLFEKRSTLSLVDISLQIKKTLFMMVLH